MPANINIADLETTEIGNGNQQQKQGEMGGVFLKPRETFEFFAQ
jgi:hypothetical protein